MEKKQNSSDGFASGMMYALAGIALGVGGKVLYDEINSNNDRETKIRQENLAPIRDEHKKESNVGYVVQAHFNGIQLYPNNEIEKNNQNISSIKKKKQDYSHFQRISCQNHHYIIVSNQSNCFRCSGIFKQIYGCSVCYDNICNNCFISFKKYKAKENNKNGKNKKGNKEERLEKNVNKKSDVSQKDKKVRNKAKDISYYLNNLTITNSIPSNLANISSTTNTSDVKLTNEEIYENNSNKKKKENSSIKAQDTVTSNQSANSDNKSNKKQSQFQSNQKNEESLIKANIKIKLNNLRKEHDIIEKEINTNKNLLLQFINEELKENSINFTSQNEINKVFSLFSSQREKLIKNIKETKSLLFDLQNTKNLKEKNLCAICFERPIEVVLAPCGHKCLCQKDGQLLLSKKQNCPICRKKIDSIVEKIFE